MNNAFAAELRKYQKLREELEKRMDDPKTKKTALPMLLVQVELLNKVIASFQPFAVADASQ